MSYIHSLLEAGIFFNAYVLFFSGIIFSAYSFFIFIKCVSFGADSNEINSLLVCGLHACRVQTDLGPA